MLRLDETAAMLAVWAVKRQQAKQLRPLIDRASAIAAEAALADMRRQRDAGEFNADEEIIVDRMERLHASRPRPEGSC